MSKLVTVATLAVLLCFVGIAVALTFKTTSKNDYSVAIIMILLAVVFGIFVLLRVSEEKTVSNFDNYYEPTLENFEEQMENKQKCSEECAKKKSTV
jgi:cytochrome c biogenesis protein CcdA